MFSLPDERELETYNPIYYPIIFIQTIWINSNKNYEYLFHLTCDRDK